MTEEEVLDFSNRGGKNIELEEWGRVPYDARCVT
jgi:hypothetical protein